MNKNDIKIALEERFTKYNYKLYKETKEQWLERNVEINYLILTTELKILDLCKNLRNKYLLNSGKLPKKSEKDILQFNCKFISLIMYNHDLEFIKKRYTDNFDEVEERMLFRIELYKEGWTIEQIEKYIYKYIYKIDYDLTEVEIEEYSVRYNNVLNKLIEYKKEKEKKNGRPCLPDILKKYLKEKHSSEVKHNMRKKYQDANKYNNIKDYLLSKEDLDKLKELIKDDAELLNKLTHLKLNFIEIS